MKLDETTSGEKLFKKTQNYNQEKLLLIKIIKKPFEVKKLKSSFSFIWNHFLFIFLLKNYGLFFHFLF